MMTSEVILKTESSLSVIWLLRMPAEAWLPLADSAEIRLNGMLEERERPWEWTVLLKEPESPGIMIISSKDSWLAEKAILDPRNHWLDFYAWIVPSQSPFKHVSCHPSIWRAASHQISTLCHIYTDSTCHREWSALLGNELRGGLTKWWSMDKTLHHGHWSAIDRHWQWWCSYDFLLTQHEHYIVICLIQAYISHGMTKVTLWLYAITSECLWMQ